MTTFAARCQTAQRSALHQRTARERGKALRGRRSLTRLPIGRKLRIDIMEEAVLCFWSGLTDDEREHASETMQVFTRLNLNLCLRKL